MRWRIFLAAALVVATPASAEISETAWQGPKDAVIAKAWPRGTDGKVIYGGATLDCAIGPAGRAKDCVVVEESVPGAGLGAAALRLAPQFKRRAGRSREGRARLEIEHEFDTPPTWVKQPSIEAIVSAIPAKAGSRPGRATIVCTVMLNGILSKCSVAEEDPVGFGFGDAALLLMPSLAMRPAMKEGQSVSTEVHIPVNFQGTGGASTQIVSVVNNLPWVTAATMDEVVQAFPSSAIGRAQRGDVGLQCDVTKDGKVRECVVISAAPSGLGFERSAVKLTTRFSVRPEVMKDLKKDLKVNLRIQMLLPGAPGLTGRRLSTVNWLRTIDPKAAQAVYPVAAVNAGVLTGTARLECEIDGEGLLSGCTVSSETPANLGFGESALAVSKAFKASPWAEDGLPSKGAKVTMPIRLVHDSAPPAP